MVSRVAAKMKKLELIDSDQRDYINYTSTEGE